MRGQFPLPVVHNPAYDDHERGQGANNGGDDGSGIVWTWFGRRGRGGRGLGDILRTALDVCARGTHIDMEVRRLNQLYLLEKTILGLTYF